jgi:hypothetical protein
VFAGIIDVLISYGAKKKLERAFKGTFHDGTAVSVNKLDFYKSRFVDYINGS